MQQQSIAVGVILNKHRQVLICKRNNGKHLAGCWEFPGGKLEQGESFKFALRRELYEEVGVIVRTAIKVLETHHQYSDRLLRFQFYKIPDYDGEIAPRENQQMRWVSINELNTIQFPEANRAIIDALILPNHYMIADEKVFSNKLMSCVEEQLNNGVRIIQHRANFDEEKSVYIQHAKQLKRLCEVHSAKYISNCSLDWVSEIQPHGIHLPSHMLKEIGESKVSKSSFEYFSASCHDEHEVNVANQLNVRCALIGPVNVTKSHPNDTAIGWKRFNELCFSSNMLVYAIGGMKLADDKTASIYGAQGIAAIRAFL